MLILTRNVNQKVIIGKQALITIVVLGVRRGQVRLGIQAPQEFPVNREEIFNRIQLEEKAAIS